MKNITTILSLLILTSTHWLSAQDLDQRKKDFIKTQKIAFFTQKLDLTPDEAQQFWPVYNDYQNRLNKIHDERRSMSSYYKSNTENISDSELSEMTDKYINLQVRESQLKKEFHEKFKKILSPSKMMKLYQAEEQFTQWLLRQLRQSRQESTPKRRG